jgi:hypothetical protein
MLWKRECVECTWCVGVRVSVGPEVRGRGARGNVLTAFAEVEVVVVVVLRVLSRAVGAAGGAAVFQLRG